MSKCEAARLPEYVDTPERLLKFFVGIPKMDSNETKWQSNTIFCHTFQIRSSIALFF